MWKDLSHLKCLNELLLQCAVLWILMFLGLPDPSLFYLDPDPNPSTNKLKILKNLDLCDFFYFSLPGYENWCTHKCLQKVKSKNMLKIFFFFGTCQALAKNAESGSADPKCHRSTTLPLLTRSLLRFLHLRAVFLFKRIRYTALEKVKGSTFVISMWGINFERAIKI